MKKIFILVMVVMLFSSCGKDFITLSPIAQLSTGNFYKTASDIDQAVNGAYNSLASNAEYGANFENFMEIPSDNTYNSNTTQSGGENAAFDNFVVLPSNSVLNTTWSACYAGIQRCNVVLNRIDAIAMDNNIKANRIGEVKFIRALSYFNLVRIWGDVPLVTKEVTNTFDAFADKRNASADVYGQIIKDLNEAAAALPATYSATDAGRVTKGAAQTLLGKVYLTLHQYSDAVNSLKNVINPGGTSVYTLLTNFKDVFDAANKNSKESIFEIQYLKNTNGSGTNYDPTNISDANNRPSANIVALFTANNDPRLALSVGYNGGLAYSTKRYDTRGTDGSFGHNVIVLRYADALLMYAEALNELGYDATGQGDAFKYLNQIRTRAGVTTYNTTSLPDQQSFRSAIDKERRLELAFENHRWFDLLRTGQMIAVMNSSTGTSAIPYTVKNYQTLFAIPQTQINASANNLTQNPGY
jgi:hypothetical protein